MPTPRLLAVCVMLAFATAVPTLAAQEVAATDDRAAANAAAATNPERSDLRAQVLLDRALFSPGEIDGVAGSNQARAVRGFQRKHALEASGELDDATWAALEADAAPTLTEVVLTAEQLAGPYVRIPADMMDKSKLDRLGYRDAAEALGEAFHASPALLRELNPGTEFAAGATIRVPNVALDTTVPTATKVVVDESERTVSLLGADDAVLAQFPATTGSEHDPLPVGEWKINGVARDPTFNYNPDLFWDANPAHSAAPIAAGPNNPVGRVWVDLSKEHYGIHGTPEPARIGKSQSHGCIRLTNWDALRLAAAVAPGMVALLQD